MDPLESVREFREHSEGRKLRVAPPPVIPAAAPPADDHVGDLVDLVDVGDGAEEGEVRSDEAAAAGHVPGTARGRKRLLQVYLPAGTRRLLDEGKQTHGTLGAAAMAAMRGAYEHIVANHTPEPAAPVGPFPAPRPTRRRLTVDDARMRPIYVDPAEAAAIEGLADQCQLSISELVTIAIDHWYGRAPSSR